MSTFTFKGKDFLLDGKPFQIMSGAMHYWRIVPEYWEDRLKKLRATGLNTVETYVCWNLHERKEGQFDFSGILDIERYISIAESLGLKVIVRPGPYICSEFDFGGLPSWLLNYENINIRCNDKKYLEKVRPYYNELLSRIRPHLCTNGGGIIMVQIENEYGSYGDDKDYLRAIADIYKENGIDCLLYTSDGPGYWMLNGGTLPEYPCVANFGSHPMEAFEVLDDFRPNQPSMCGEFWCGWFNHWGEQNHTRSVEETLRDLVPMIESGASFNFYMFHGGTNFAFTNGANHSEGVYQPTVTSYDYDAPVSESGDLRPTYFAVRDVIAKKTGYLPPLDVENTKKKAYGKLALTKKAPLFSNIDNISEKKTCAAPLTMEQAGQDFGFIMYSTTLTGPMEKRYLCFGNVRDRATVFIDGEKKSIFYRNAEENGDQVWIELKKGESLKLDVLVENCGRVNYGPELFDKKGIVGGIRLEQMFHYGWDIYSMTMDDLSGLVYQDETADDNRPAFLKGELEINEEPCDTFIRLDGFHKGFVVVNGFNIGRYWNDKGPTKTLFVPAPLLRKGKNDIIVFESDAYEKPEIEFFAEPNLG